MTKRILLTVFFAVSVLFSLNATTYTVDDLPVKKGGILKFVCNPDHVLDDSTENKINYMLQKLEDSTTVQVLVVAVDSIQPADVFRFSEDLGEKYGVGQKDKNNGLVVLLVTSLRQIRFSTGTGLEGDLPDAICKRIQSRYMVPYFKDNEWNEGMLQGVLATCDVLGGDTELKEHLANDESEDDEDISFFEGVGIAFGIVLVCLLLASPFIGFLLLAFIIFRILKWYRTRCPNCKTKMEKIGTDTLNGKKVNVYRCPHCGLKKNVSEKQTSSYWTWVGSITDSSSSGSDSSSSSGSSWGGGSFGGGGSSSSF